MTGDERLDDIAKRALRAIVQVEMLANDLTLHTKELRSLVEKIKETSGNE